MWKLITYIGLMGLLGGLIMEAATHDPGWRLIQTFGFILALPWAVFGED